MSERLKFDDGSRMSGDEIDYDPSIRHHHYSIRGGHGARAMAHKLREQGIMGLSIEAAQMVRRQMRRDPASGRK